MKPTSTFLAVLTVLGLGLRAQAQYSIDWHTIDGGGGTSTGGVYVVSGTIGQPDASGAMTNGPYSLTGGFWSLYAVQMPGAPTLYVTNAGLGAVTVWWSPATAGWILQQTDSLSATNWVDAPSGTNNPAILSAPSRARFYRLH